MQQCPFLFISQWDIISYVFKHPFKTGTLKWFEIPTISHLNMLCFTCLRFPGTPRPKKMKRIFFQFRRALVFMCHCHLLLCTVQMQIIGFKVVATPNVGVRCVFFVTCYSYRKKSSPSGNDTWCGHDSYVRRKKGKITSTMFFFKL